MTERHHVPGLGVGLRSGLVPGIAAEGNKPSRPPMFDGSRVELRTLKPLLVAARVADGGPGPTAEPARGTSRRRVGAPTGGPHWDDLHGFDRVNAGKAVIEVRRHCRKTVEVDRPDPPAAPPARQVRPDRRGERRPRRPGLRPPQ